MNFVDVLVLTVIAFSGMMGFLRGMIREVFGLAAWIGAFFVSMTFFSQAQGFARRVIENPDFADPVAFGGLFLIVLVALSLFARTLGGAVRGSLLGGLDRTLGLLFGLVRGGALLCAAYVIAGMVVQTADWPPAVLEARTLPTIYLGAAWAAERVPLETKPVVTPPPGERSARAADLYRLPPSGRATAAAPPASGFSQGLPPPPPPPSPPLPPPGPGPSVPPLPPVGTVQAARPAPAAPLTAPPPAAPMPPRETARAPHR